MKFGTNLDNGNVVLCQKGEEICPICKKKQIQYYNENTIKGYCRDCLFNENIFKRYMNDEDHNYPIHKIEFKEGKKK